MYLFVYGTLRNDLRHDMYHVLARSATFIADGRVRARLYDLGDYPGMVLSSDPSDITMGEVYELSAERAQDVLKVLDEYEGLGPSDPAPHEYRRAVVQVALADGRVVPAWAYILTQENPKHPRINDSDYLTWRNQHRSA